MHSFLYLVLLFVGAIFFGKAAARLKQPPIVGYILGGMVFGPMLIASLKGIDQLAPGDPFQGAIANLDSESIASDLSMIMDVAIIFIMFASGLEISIKQFKGAFKTGVLPALLGVLVPLLSGFAGTYILTGDLLSSLFVGGALSITAVAITVASLIDIDAIDTRFGMTIITAAIDDDIIGIIIVSMILGLAGVGGSLGIPSVIGMLLTSILFVIVMVFLMPKVLTRIYRSIGDIGTAEGLGFTLIIAFTTGLISHLIGLHFLIGAFLGGMVVKGLPARSVHKTIERISNGFFTPLFFAWVGFFITISGAVFSIFMPMILLIGFMGKIIGSGLGAKLSGLNWAESFLVGAGMNSRLGVELVLISLALHAGIINVGIYSAIIINGALMSLVTPILLKKAYGFFMRKGMITDNA